MSTSQQTASSASGAEPCSAWWVAGWKRYVDQFTPTWTGSTYCHIGIQRLKAARLRQPNTTMEERGASHELFGFPVVLSASEMMTLIRAMSEKTQNARWFANNNLFGSREQALRECDQQEARIAELKAMEPQIIKPNA